MLESAYAFGEECVLHVAVAVEVFVCHEDVHEHFAHELCAVVAGVVLDDDVLEFCQAFLDAGVLFVVLLFDVAECFDGESSLQECFDEGVDVFVLEGHVVAHFLCVLVVEAQDEHCQAVACGEVDGFEELAPDAWQTEIDEVAV